MFKKHSESKILSVLKEYQSGIGSLELCRKHGISKATLYKWKSKYQDMSLSDISRLKILTEEIKEQGFGRYYADITLPSGKKAGDIGGFDFEKMTPIDKKEIPFEKTEVISSLVASSSRFSSSFTSVGCA